MREIRFRGMDLEGRWHIGLLAITKEHGHTISNSAGMPFAYKVRPETVTQFTGLKDKNEKDIYELDILESEISKKCAPVEWNKSTASFNCKSEYIDISPINFIYAKIIGNIFENPELLK